MICCTCAGLQATAVVWPLVWGLTDPNERRVWALPVGLFLTSLGWWEGFVGEWITGYLYRLKGVFKQKDCSASSASPLFVLNYKRFACSFTSLQEKLTDQESSADVNLGVAPLKICAFFLVFLADSAQLDPFAGFIGREKEL